MEVYLRPFPEVASARWQVSTTCGVQPVWAHSGRELFYRNGRNDFVAAEVRTAPALGFFQSYAVTPGDRRFLMVREGAPSQQSELILTENWFQELKAQTRQ